MRGQSSQGRDGVTARAPVTTGQDQQAQAVGLFLTDALLQI
jgi:hypothetical protein